MKVVEKNLVELMEVNCGKTTEQVFDDENDEILLAERNNLEAASIFFQIFTKFITIHDDAAPTIPDTQGLVFIPTIHTRLFLSLLFSKTC